MTSSEDAVEEENNDALWRLFRNAGAFSGGVCRDVVEKHVLPRLNSNDVKFLYGVNEAVSYTHLTRPTICSV